MAEEAEDPPPEPPPPKKKHKKKKKKKKDKKDKTGEKGVESAGPKTAAKKEKSQPVTSSKLKQDRGEESDDAMELLEKLKTMGLVPKEMEEELNKIKKPKRGKKSKTSANDFEDIVQTIDSSELFQSSICVPSLEDKNKHQSLILSTRIKKLGVPSLVRGMGPARESSVLMRSGIRRSLQQERREAQNDDHWTKKDDTKPVASHLLTPNLGDTSRPRGAEAPESWRSTAPGPPASNMWQPPQQPTPQQTQPVQNDPWQQQQGYGRPNEQYGQMGGTNETGTDPQRFHQSGQQSWNEPSSGQPGGRKSGGSYQQQQFQKPQENQGPPPSSRESASNQFGQPMPQSPWGAPQPPPPSQVNKGYPSMPAPADQFRPSEALKSFAASIVPSLENKSLAQMKLSQITRKTGIPVSFRGKIA